MTKAQSAKKSAKKATLPLKGRAVRAALDLAAEKGWDKTGLQDIAKRCKCSLADLNDIFEDRGEILAAYERQIDRRVLAQVGKPDLTTPERDRLFDVLMERFDVLGEDRAAVVSILKSFRLDPKQAVIGIPHLGKSMLWMLEAAGVESAGAKGALTAFGLIGVYLYTLKAWMDDDSEDQSKTMAALDRALGRAETLAGFILTKF
jgi:AcrR family transcriptional regulator